MNNTHEELAKLAHSHMELLADDGDGDTVEILNALLTRNAELEAENKGLKEAGYDLAIEAIKDLDKWEWNDLDKYDAEFRRIYENAVRACRMAIEVAKIKATPPKEQTR